MLRPDRSIKLDEHLFEGMPIAVLSARDIQDTLLLCFLKFNRKKGSLVRNEALKGSKARLNIHNLTTKERLFVKDFMLSLLRRV